jgi:hypothetical protein
MRFRVGVHAMVTYPFFDTFIMIIIVGSSIALAAEDPVDEKSERNEILAYFDYIFTCIFAVEMVLKVCETLTSDERSIVALYRFIKKISNLLNE